MYQKFKLLILFLCAVASATVVFGANAQIDVQSKPFVSDASAPIFRPPSYNDGIVASTSVKRTTARPNALGYYMLNQGETQVGSTEFDWQSYDSQQRQVAIGTDGKIHTAWTYREYGIESPTVADRYVYYNGYQANGTPSNPFGADMSGGTGGYGAITVAPGEALAIAAYGYTKQGSGYDPRPRTAIGKQAAVFSPLFNMIDYPSSDSVMTKYLNCQNIKTGLDTMETGYYWPRIAIDVNGSGQTIAHVLTKEHARPKADGGDTTGKASLIYYRTAVDAAGPGSCGTFIDSVAGSINYDIAASQVSEKVAAVYQYPRLWTGYDLGDNDDVVYKESSDRGATWSSSRINIPIFGPEDSIVSGGRVFYERSKEVSALYTEDDCLHILYLTYWTSSDHYYLIYPARLYHWSSCNPMCHVMLLDANGTWGPSGGVRPPLGQNLIAKISLTQCAVGSNKRLYAVYTMYPDSTGIAGNTHSDRSITPILNGDVVVQGSPDMSGELWGPPVNVSNTYSDGCSPGNCASEQFTNAAIYSSDSLRIQYLVDKDAGSAIMGTYTNPQGVLTDNPMVVRTYPCYALASEAFLSVDPDSIVWPFHTTPAAGPNHTNSVPVTLTNTGTTSANYTRAVYYTPAGNWLSFANPASSTVPAGCTRTQAETITATGPATEGLYRATVTWSYNGGKTLTMPVSLYNFNAANWFVEQNGTINTVYLTMSTNQTSRIGRMRPGAGFNYQSDGGDTAYMYDGSLLIGKDSLSLSTGLFADTTAYSGGVSGHGDTLLGRLFCLNNMVFDEVGVSPQGYRHSSGMGCNKDSSIAFDVDFYAPKPVDSSHFMIGRFSLYAGPKNPGATIPNVMVAYAADWNVPDDSSDNIGGFDPALQMVYQKGAWGSNATRNAALSGWREDGTPITGGMVLMNRRSIHRLGGYVTDSIWTTIKNFTGYSTTDSIGDLNSMLVFSKNATITPKASGVFTVYVLFAGQPGHQLGYTGSLDNLKAEMAKAKKFMCNWLSPNPALCPVVCTGCGDANSDGEISISDAVFLIEYVFSGGVYPADCSYALGKGDANGDGRVSVADVVYLICYIFSSGPSPHCAGMYREPILDGTALATISLKCPTIVPSDHLVPGDSFRVEVYLLNEEDVSGFSAGFGHTSDLIEITSVDFSGSIVPVGGYRRWWCDPAGKRCLIGHAVKGPPADNTFIPARTEPGLLCALNVRMLPSIRPDTIDIFETFVPPAGFLEVVSGSGCSSNTYIPQYADCGVNDIQLGSGTETNLVAFYNFNEGSGSVAHDASGTGNDGTLHNNPTWIDGIAGTAIDLNGVNEYVEIPDDPSLDLNGPFTVMCWIYPRSFSSTYTSFVNKYFNYVLQTTSSGSGLRLAFDIAGGGAHAANSPNGTLTLSEWQHIAGVWDGGTIRVYRNGIEVGSSYQGNLTPLVQNTPLHIGTNQVIDQFFHGTIDNVKIYRGALTPSQIQQEFAGFVCGDANADAIVDIADAVHLINYIFKGGPAPSPLEAGDANCDSVNDIADAVYLITYIFKEGPVPCALCK